MALLARADGDPEGAVDLLDQAEQLYRPGFFPDVRPIAAIRARIWIAQGELAEAADWARERGVSATDDARYLREFDHLTLVRLLLAQHRAHQDADALDQAPVCWTGCPRPPTTAGRAGSLLEIRLLQALAHDAQGRRPQALETLAQALALGARARGLRPALPGRGRTHGRAAARRRASQASAATTRDDCSSLGASAGAQAPDRAAARRRRRRPRR